MAILGALDFSFPGMNEDMATTGEHVLTLNIEVASKSDLGLVRRMNQDSFGSDDARSLYVICDGMGGAAGGEVASQIATETFLSIAKQELDFDRTSTVAGTRLALERAAVAANRAVASRAAFDQQYRGMGTTLVGARVTGSTLVLVNVGDSRAYLMHGGRAKQMTVDHSYVQEQVKLGLMTEAQAAVSSMQSLITRAIGAEEDVHPDLFEVMLEVGDVVLLTSDGLTRHVSDEEIAELLSPEHSPSAEESCRRLIELAKDGGGSDNITCIVLRVSEAE